MTPPSGKPIVGAPRRLVVVRHGATEWSKGGRHTGKTDVPLLPEGETEALALRDRLCDLEAPSVFSSPLKRALDTCVLAGFGEDVVTLGALEEMDYGDYEGLTTPEIRAERPGWDLYRDGCPHGETIDEVADRVRPLLDGWCGEGSFEGRDVLVFAHGHLLRVMAALWLSLDPDRARHFRLSAGQTGRLEWEHSWRTVSSWNV